MARETRDDGDNEGYASKLGRGMAAMSPQFPPGSRSFAGNVKASSDGGSQKSQGGRHRADSRRDLGKKLG